MKTYVDWGKLFQVAMLLASTVVLAIVEVLDPAVVTLVFGAAAGYVFGNGKSVRGGHAPAPIIGLRDESEPAAE